MNAVCMKDCNGGRIPESEICPPPTKRCADGVEVAVDTVCRKHCNGGLIPESEICPPPPTTKRCADGLEIALSAVCMKDCNGGRIPESEICPTTKRCADGLEVALDAVCMKHCNGGRIPESETCPTTKRCADGVEVALDAVCMKDCNGGRIPESEICPPPTKRCADGLEVALNAVCMKDCNGGRIPESEICPPPTKRCADGLDVAVSAVCMKDCNGRRIPEMDVCPSPPPEFRTETVSCPVEGGYGRRLFEGVYYRRLPAVEAVITGTTADELARKRALECEYYSNRGLAVINARHAYNRGYWGQGVTILSGEDYIRKSHVDFRDASFPDIRHRSDFGLFFGHPTSIAGLLVARRNGKGMHGVAPQAELGGTDMWRGHAVNRARRLIPQSQVISNSNGGFHPRRYYGTFRGEHAHIPGIVGINAIYALTSVPENWDVSTKPYLSTYLTIIASSDVVYVHGAGNDALREDSPVIVRICDNPGKYYCADLDSERPEITVAASTAIAEFVDSISGPLRDLTLSPLNPSPESLVPFAFPDMEKHWLSVVNLGVGNTLHASSNQCRQTKNWCVAAPGERTYSTLLNGDEEWGNFGGTSAATPHVAGALAVMRSAAQEISMTVHRRILLTTTTDLGAPGVDEVYGHGLVNLSAAIVMIEARKTPPMDGLFRSFSPLELGGMVPSEFAHLGDKIGDAEIAVKLADNFYYNAPLSKLLRPTAKAKTPLGDIGAEMTAPIIAASSSGFAAAGDGENNFALRWNGLGENTALMAEYAQSESESGIWEKSASGKILLRRNLFGGLSAFGEYERKRLQSDIGGGGFLAGTDNAQADGWLAGMEWTADERGKSRFRFWAKERMRLSGGDLIMRYPHYDGDLRVREKRVPLREKGERIWSAGYASVMGVGGEWTAAAAYNSGTGEKKLSARWEWELR